MRKYVFVVALCLCFQTLHVFACRYNVRDIGFVDLGDKPYIFYGFVKNDTAADTVSEFTKIIVASLMETNIKGEIVNIDRTERHPAVRFVDSLGIKSFPAAVLVSPDDRVISISVTERGKPFKDTLSGAINAVVSSPARQRIIENSINTFSVVLLVKCPDAAENELARHSAMAAIDNITGAMATLPKAISTPPVLVQLEPADFVKERILLWSMGLDADRTDRPAVAIFYGRARRMGPVLTGRDITDKRLTSLLSVVGADCECGLDRAWMTGPLLPARWDSRLAAEASKKLGFDPENPMVKLETSQILRGFGASSAFQPDPDLLAGVSLGYQEIVVEFGVPPAQNRQNQADDANLVTVLSEPPNRIEPAASSPLQKTQPPQFPLTEHQDSATQRGLLSGGILSGFILAGLLIIIIGLIIYSRSARKNR